jgi:hypothetical protein
LLRYQTEEAVAAVRAAFLRLLRLDHQLGQGNTFPAQAPLFSGPKDLLFDPGKHFLQMGV